MGICQVNKLVVGSKNTEKGSIQIYGKDIDVLKLGDATHEGGDVKIYRDASGNLQFSLDADAASNAIAMSVYGGVVAQNYLTVGQSALYTASKLYVNGDIRTYSHIHTTSGNLIANANHGLFSGENETPIVINLNVVSGTCVHQAKMQIDGSNIFIIEGTGNGAGGVDTNTLKALFYAPTFHADTPQTLTGAGAVNLTTSITHLVTTGADALTLADGAEGQIKYIIMKTDGGDGTLTPTNYANGTTLTFDDVGDSVMLLFTNGAWHWMGGRATSA